MFIRCSLLALLVFEKKTNSYGKSPFLMGKLTISMAISNSYVKLPEGRPCGFAARETCTC